jgi:hypothetical protein
MLLEGGLRVTFDEDGNPTGIGPLRMADLLAMLKPMETDYPDESVHLL